MEENFNAPLGQRFKLKAVPFSKNITFGVVGKPTQLIMKPWLVSSSTLFTNDEIWDSMDCTVLSFFLIYRSKNLYKHMGSVWFQLQFQNVENIMF